MLILRKDKYTSAAPRCTCLPPHQHCTEVALGGKQVHLCCSSMFLSSSLCNFSSSPLRPSPGTTGLCLVVPGLGLGGLEWSLRWPPRTTSAQVHLGQVQVQLGFASLYLDLTLVDLRGGCDGKKALFRLLLLASILFCVSPSQHLGGSVIREH